MTKFSAATPCNFRPPRFCDPHNATRRVTVAVSACLAGEKVRYDGDAKLLPTYPLLSRELNLISVCPEMAAGLGVPRPPVQLIAVDNQIRALGRENPQLDVTAALQNVAALSLQQLLKTHLLCGYLWKSRSPSCGFGSTPLFTAEGVELGRTSGIQADYFRRHLPHLNYCEESALETADMVRVFVLRCRLVFDVQHADAYVALQTLHRHYAFLHENFHKGVTEKLKALGAANNRTGYLAALLEGCSQIPAETLLKLFD